LNKDKAIDLAKYFFAELRGDITTASAFHKNMIIEQFLRLDVDPSDAMRIMVDYKTKYPHKAKDLSNIMEIFNKPANNLIKPGVFYYHPQLQMASKMPKLKQLDTGDFVEVYDSEEDKHFYLHIVPYFTIDDIVDYFHQTMKTKQVVKNRDTASIKRLLDMLDYNLDLLLYTIDAAYYDRKSKDLSPLKSPIYLTDYIDQGEIVLGDRINTCKVAGLDHVVG
jgi:hypothetical protein